MRENSPLKEIHFITATPFKRFWKKLRSVSISELKSIDQCQEIDRRDQNFKNLLENYRGINDHNYIHTVTNLTPDPILYASYVILNLNTNNEPKCIFAPASNTTESHNIMKNFFKSKNYDVIILNGKNKKLYFCSDNTEIELTKFNMKYNLQNCELRDTLRKYREIYPNNNLCITGNRVIERGITFCTNGFNFTDLIISKYHSKNISSLVQLFGRSCGDKKYVDKMNIWCPQEVYDIVNKRIQICKNILETNPEYYTEKDFREKTKREMKENCMTVPILINTTSKEYDTIIKKKNNIKKFLNIFLYII